MKVSYIYWTSGRGGYPSPRDLTRPAAHRCPLKRQCSDHRGVIAALAEYFGHLSQARRLNSCASQHAQVRAKSIRIFAEFLNLMHERIQPFISGVSCTSEGQIRWHQRCMYVVHSFVTSRLQRTKISGSLVWSRRGNPINQLIRHGTG